MRKTALPIFRRGKYYGHQCRRDLVKKFYDAHGWKGGEDALFRQFRPAYQPYHAKTEARTLECFKGRSGALLIAGGGDLPQSHLDIANKFSNVTCVDISQIALDIAEQRLPSAQKLPGSICALPEHYSDQFDCAFASHIIYHIEANQQSKAVRELIRACKPGGRIVILYSNRHHRSDLLLVRYTVCEKSSSRKRRFRRPDYTSLRTRSAGGSSSKMTATSP